MTQYPDQVRNKVSQSAVEGAMNGIAAMTGIDDVDTLKKAASIKAPLIERRLNTAYKIRRAVAEKKTANYTPDFISKILPAQ